MDKQIKDRNYQPMNLKQVFTLTALCVSASCYSATNYDVVPVTVSGDQSFSVAMNNNGEIVYVQQNEESFYNSFVRVDDTSLIPGFATLNEEGEYNTNLLTFVRDINEQGNFVGGGMAPLETKQYTNEDGEEVSYQVNEFWRNGFVYINGVQYRLASALEGQYAHSQAEAISNDNRVVGYALSQFTDEFQVALDGCNEDVRGEQPYDSCINSIVINNSLAISDLHVPDKGFFDVKAVAWDLNSEGEWVLTEFNHLVEREEGDERLFNSRAYDVNTAGIAVGQSQTYYQDFTNFNSDLRRVVTMPAIFNGETTSGILDDNEFSSGAAVSINDSGLVAGYGSTLVSGSIRNILFIHDINNSTTEFPERLFTGSQTEPASMNSHGQVVGYAFSEPTATATMFSSGVPPEITAFLYEHNNAAAGVIDLNERIACDSGYYLARATDVNDNGEILADAVTTRQETDDAGNVTTVDMIVPVKLVPSDEASGCVKEVNTEGNAGGFGLSFLLFSLVGTLRRFKK